MYSSRIFGYDLLKALSISGVIIYLLHSLYLEPFPEEGVYFPEFSKFLMAILSASVPLFFMVHGAVVGRRELTIKKCIQSSLRLFLIGTFWSVFFNLFLFPLVFGESPASSFWDFYLIYWFLFTLSGIYPIIWVLNRVPLLRKLVVSVLVFYPFVTNFVWDIILFISPDTQFPSWGHSGAMTFYSIVYFYLGRRLSAITAPISCSVISIVLGLLLVNFEVFSLSNAFGYVYDSVNSCFPTLGAAFVSMGLFLLLKDLQPDRSSWFVSPISFLGRNTLGVYIFQALIVTLIRQYVFHFQPQNPFVVFGVALSVCFLGSIIWHIIMYLLEAPRHLYHK